MHTGTPELSRDAVLLAMAATEQCPGVSVLDHGNAVAAAYDLLHANITQYLRGGNRSVLPDWWRVPTWVYTHAHFISRHLLPRDAVHEYHVWHDCGKPFCREVDTAGTHFRNHAAISAEIYGQISDRALVRTLISLDMEAHTLRPGTVAAFVALGPLLCCTLLLTAVAEVHANAPMFGGSDSDSFKIKIKRLDKLGARVVDALVASEASKTM